MKIIITMWLVVLTLLAGLVYCQWQTHRRVTGLQEQLSMRLPVVVLDIEPRDTLGLERLPGVVQEKVRRLAAAGYLVLKRSQVVAAPDDILLFQQQASHEKRR